MGLIGDESTHADHMVRWWAEHPEAGAALTAVVRPTKAWRALGADRPEELVGRVDAVVILARDAASHRDLAKPLLRAGLPVFVDKPVAAREDDVVDLLETARRHGGRLTSFSALRFQPRSRSLVDQVHTLGPLRELSVQGPADRGTWAFYGVHSFELALHLAGGPATEIVVVEQGGTLSVRLRLGRIAVSVELSPGARYVVTASGNRALGHTVVPVMPRYFDAVSSRVTAFLAGGPAPVTDDQLLDVARIVEAVGRGTGPTRSD